MGIERRHYSFRSSADREKLINFRDGFVQYFYRHLHSQMHDDGVMAFVHKLTFKRIYNERIARRSVEPMALLEGLVNTPVGVDIYLTVLDVPEYQMRLKKWETGIEKDLVENFAWKNKGSIWFPIHDDDLIREKKRVIWTR